MPYGEISIDAVKRQGPPLSFLHVCHRRHVWTSADRPASQGVEIRPLFQEVIHPERMGFLMGF